MLLPTEIFEQVIGRPCLPAELPAADRRGTVRAGISGTATGIPFKPNGPAKAPGEPFTARLRDLSRSGVGFVHQKPMRAGEEFALRLPRVGPAKPLWVYCLVARWQPLTKELYVIGATFDRILDVQPRPGAVALAEALAAG